MSDDEGMWAWHVHHVQLVERLDEGGLEARADYIRNHKPTEEVAKRLRLLKVVQDQNAVSTASASLTAARDFVDRAREAGDLSEQAYVKALDGADRAYHDAIGALHAKECPNCPWDGETIFPKVVD